MLKKEGFSKRMERSLSEWQKRFEARRTASEKSGSPVAAELADNLGTSKVAGEAAFAKLEELRAAAVRWLEIRRELEKMWKEIEDLEGSKAASGAAPQP